MCYFWDNCMEQSTSCEANSSSASQEFPCILWNLAVHNCLPPVLCSALGLPSCFIKTHCNVVLPSVTRYSKLPFLTKTLCWFLFHLHVCNMHRPSHTFWFDCPNNIPWSVPITQLLTMSFPPVCYPQIPSLSAPSPWMPSLWYLSLVWENKLLPLDCVLWHRMTAITSLACPHLGLCSVHTADAWHFAVEGVPSIALQCTVQVYWHFSRPAGSWECLSLPAV